MTSFPYRLHLPREIYEEMVAQARTELPNECCGLLGGIFEEASPGSGRIGRVTRRYPLVNAAENPTKRYASELRSIKTAYQEMDRQRLEMLAVYHSHPTSEPRPSPTDLELSVATGPDVVNLIISLHGVEPAMRGWWLTERDFREAEWCLV
jgi:proteasome lid subunit RPN8/RPN11